MLHDIGFPFPVSDAALDADGESVFADLRFGEFGADGRLDLLIFLRAGAGGGGSLFGGGRGCGLTLTD